MKTMTAIGVAMMISLAASPAAIAGKPAAAANKGNQGCLLVADTSTHKNPGKMMQHVRENSDAIGPAGTPANQNPVQWLANFPGFTGSVGDWIQRNCKVLD